VDGIKGEVIEHVQGALSRNNNLAHEVEEFVKFREFIDKLLFDYGRRLATIEIDMKSAIAACILGQMKSAGIVDPDKPAPAARPVPAEVPAFIQVRAPLPAWKKETKEAADKLGSALPALVSIPELAAYFGVSHTKIHTAVVKGRLAVTRKGQVMAAPRESVAEYVRVYGVPRQRKLFYGSAGVTEYPK